MTNKILIALTSHSQLGNTGKPTGAFLKEFTHPHKVFLDAGYAVDFASPQGGKVPIDGFDLSDETNKQFMENPILKSQIENSLKLSEIQSQDYDAIFLAGGHGTMWDFPDDTNLIKILEQAYNQNKPIGSACHGVAGFLNIKDSNGQYIVKGKKVNSFTNDEEHAVNLQDVVPFMLETELTNRGGIFEKSDLWQSHVAVDGNLVTGQNPASAIGCAEEIVKQLKQ
jgi:putative intracellular protease/amidase